MPTTRKTGRERINNVDKEIAAVLAKKKAIMKNEKEKIEKKIKNKYFTSFNRAERTDFHILKGKYAETKLKQEKGTVDDFEALIDELIEESAVKIILNRHEEKIKARLEEEEKQNDDNDIDFPKAETVENNNLNIIEVPKLNINDIVNNGNNNNKVDVSEIQKAENENKMIADLNKTLEIN